MAITNIQRDWGVGPSLIRITSTDDLATVATAGYISGQAANIFALNNGAFEFVVGDTVLVTASDYNQFFDFTDDTFSSLQTLPGGNGAVDLPVVSGDFAMFDGTLGGLNDTGLSPTNAAKTKVVMANAAVTANHIAVYTDTAGTIGDDAATAINLGNIQAGASGTAGYVASFPATGSKGSLHLVAVASTGDTVTAISNAAMGQATVFTIPDPAGSTANIVVAPAALVSGNLVQASGTAGLVADQGFAMKSVYAAAAAGGNAAQAFTDAFCTTGSVVIGNWVTQANAEEVVKIVPANGSFTVTSTGDVGAGTFSYIITK